MSGANEYLPENIYDYMTSVSVREPAILRRLREETASNPQARDADSAGAWPVAGAADSIDGRAADARSRSVYRIQFSCGRARAAERRQDCGVRRERGIHFRGAAILEGSRASII